MKRAAVVIAAIVAAAGCEGSPPAAPGPTTASLTVSQEAATVSRNTTLALTASAQSSTGATSDVTSVATWSSSNDTVATVAAGVVTVKALGVAQITAAYDGRTASTAITGRRRTHFDGAFVVRDTGGDFTVGGLWVFLDDVQIGARGASGWDDDVSITIRGSSANKPIEPGTHTLALGVEMIAGSHEVRVEATKVTVYDSDTGEALTVLPLAGKRATLRNTERFSWTLDVPTFTQ